MFTRKATTLAGALALGASLLAAGPAGAATTVKGTVVHRNARAHSFVVAGARGALVAVHAAKSPRVGRKVLVSARRLRNGTFAAQKVRVRGTSRHVRMHGIVTFSDRRAHAFVLSARGVSLLIRGRSASHARSSSAATAAADTVPATGSVVTVTGTVDPQGDISPDNVSEDGQNTGTVELEGVVLAVDPSARTLTLSADDSDSSGSTITVSLPATFDPSAFAVGDEVQLVATLNPDGTYTAVGSSDDSGAKQADDSSDNQGDDHGDRQNGDHGSSPNSGGDTQSPGSGDSGSGSGSGADGSND